MKRIQQLLVDRGYDLGNYGPKKNGVDGSPGKVSKSALTQFIKDECKRLGYVFFQKNLYWFRMNDEFTDKFSDYCAVVINGEVKEILNATTKPGRYYVYNPVTAGGITGTGCRKEGQSIASHRYNSKGKKKWGSGAGYFSQISTLLVYRDGNKDNVLDKNIVQKAPTTFGFFCHAMGRGFSVWNWSAGCLGCPLEQWMTKIDPWFNEGDVINDTIFDV